MNSGFTYCSIMSHSRLLSVYYKQIFNDYCIFLIALLFRWFVSLYEYSGQSKPPMFGDYEAQRHWMEITASLPIKHWYFNSSDNDLLYWGLDYPPMTAYHSYINGLVLKKILPESVELNTSRGFESKNHKLLMRYSVLIVDILVYIPAVFWFFHQLFKIKSDKQIDRTMTVMLTLLYPGLILIDYGHFQYNCVSLGFFIASVTSVYANKSVLSCIFFSLALNYKQMELYHALPFFFYYIGIVFETYRKHKFIAALKTFILLVLSVTLSFIVIWAPFLTDTTQFFQVVHRIFPLERGVFEDKVSNVWCLVNVMYKLKKINNQRMAFVCLLTTIISVLPSCTDLFRNPTKSKFSLSLINCSLSFFLFSFQVHEKSILLVAVPVLLYAAQNTFMCTWLLTITSFSMLPLLLKDNLLIPFISLSVIYFIIYRNIEKTIPSKHSELGSKFSLLRNLSIIGCLVLIICCVIIEPPQKYPYLWPLLISAYSCVHFILFWLYFNYYQLMLHISKKKLY